jgi:hypothetical protein
MKESAGKYYKKNNLISAIEFATHLPRWNIIKRRSIIIATIAAILSSCNPMNPNQLTEITESSTPVVRETYTPTATKTEIPNTPTYTLTPTQTPVPRPEYATDVTEARRTKNMTLVEDLRPIQQDVIDHPLLGEPEPFDFAKYGVGIFFTEKNSSGTVVIFRGRYGITILARAFVRVADSANGVDRHYILWEVRNPGDDQSQVLTTYIGGNDASAKGIRADVDAMLDQIYKYGKLGVGLNFRFVTTLHEKFDNPVLNELLKDRPEDEAAEVKTFEDDHIITDNLQFISLWLSRIDPNFL